VLADQCLCAGRALLRDAQSSLPTARDAGERLPQSSDRLLRKLAAQCCRARGIVGDEEEVIAETYRQVFDPLVARFSPDRGGVPQYFKGLVQNATRKVARLRGGSRSHKNRFCGMMVDSLGDALSLDAVPLSVRGRTHRSPATEVEQRDEARYILDQAPPDVREALRLQYWEQRPLQEAAKAVGLSRFALRRKLDIFINGIRRKLAC